MSMPNMKLKNNQEILEKIKVLKENYLAEWNPVDGDAGWAIAQSFAEMGGGVNEKLQELPHKLFISYLDALGFSQSEALLATAPVTFKLTKGFKNSVVIPEKTEVLTEEKVSYETDNTFTATSAKLSALVCVNTLKNSVSDFSTKLLNEESMRLFDTQSQEQYLYFGDDNLFNIHRVLGDTNAYIEYMVPNIENYKWEYWGESELGGEAEWMKFESKGQRLNKKEAFKTIKKSINGVESYWIRIVLLKPNKEQVIDYSMTYRSRSGIDALYYNSQPLNPRKVIYPFGATPQKGDTFYIASSEAFSKKSAVCGIAMENISCSAEKNGNIKLKQMGSLASGFVSFEYYNGSAWKKLILKKNAEETDWVQSGINVIFDIPLDMSEVNINGDMNFWIRVKLVESNFGTYGYDNIEKKVTQLFSPPSTKKIDIYVSLKKQVPMYVFREAHESFTNLLTSDDKPYLWLEDSLEYKHLLYFGFDKAFGEGLISMLLCIAKSVDDTRLLECSAYSEDGWNSLALKDETDALLKSGLWSFVAPLKQKALDKFGKDLYWLRIGFKEEVEPVELSSIYMNSVMVTQSKTLGGKVGNVEAGFINKLSSSVAYVDKVVNHKAATGGADEQSIETLMDYAPKRIKHRYKAVSSDDFDALVKESSSSIAKVRTISQSGAVKLFIMPFSKEKKPLVSDGLKKRVQEYIEFRAPATAKIYVLEPNYKGIDVKLEVVVDDWSLASTLKNKIQEKLDEFLHPISGRDDSKGWLFGEVPTLSDILTLLAKFDGILYVKGAEIVMDGTLLYDLNGEPKVEIGADVMIYSANHTIKIVAGGR